MSSETPVNLLAPFAASAACRDAARSRLVVPFHPLMVTSLGSGVHESAVCESSLGSESSPLRGQPLYVRMTDTRALLRMVLAAAGSGLSC